MKKCYILRGLPGSGKSRKARKLVEKYPSDFYAIHSADSYFMKRDCQGDMVYTFDPKKLGIYHHLCFMSFKRSIESGKNRVILDNTNIKKSEYNRYVKVAEEYGYKVIVKVVGKFTEKYIERYAERNEHNVPIEKIRQMAEKFEF